MGQQKASETRSDVGKQDLSLLVHPSASMVLTRTGMSHTTVIRATRATTSIPRTSTLSAYQTLRHKLSTPTQYTQTRTRARTQHTCIHTVTHIHIHAHLLTHIYPYPHLHPPTHLIVITLVIAERVVHAHACWSVPQCNLTALSAVTQDSVAGPPTN
jgi:hypothetical protein